MKIDIAENIAVGCTIILSSMIAFYADNTPFIVVFPLFVAASIVLAYTTYIKQQYAIMRLQLFFILINTFAFIKLIT